MSKVYVINRSGHDFSDAERYGELVFLSEGIVDRYDLNKMYREFSHILKHSSPDDYILETSLTSLNVIACSIFAYMHGRLNLLLYRRGKYIKRELIVSELVNKKECSNVKKG